VAAAVEPVVMDEVVGVGALRPAMRGLIELNGEDARLAGAVAMVEHEGRRWVSRPVRTAFASRRHDQGVGHVLRVEVAQLLVGASFLVGEIRWWRVAALDRLVYVGWGVPGILE
jgi:hypothetical protein